MGKLKNIAGFLPHGISHVPSLDSTGALVKQNPPPLDLPSRVRVRAARALALRFYFPLLTCLPPAFPAVPALLTRLTLPPQTGSPCSDIPALPAPPGSSCSDIPALLPSQFNLRFPRLRSRRLLRWWHCCSCAKGPHPSVALIVRMAL